MGAMAFVTFDPRTLSENMIVEDQEEDTKEKSGYLTFEDYQLNKELYRGEIAPVDFSERTEATTYQSIIEKGIQSVGVNFAASYSVVTWGCGVNCQVSTIVNAITGEIVEYGIISAYGLAYSPWSSLFIVNPIENIPIDVANEEGISSDFYTLNNDAEFEYIRRHVEGGQGGSSCSTTLASARNAFTEEVRNFSCSVPYGWDVIENNF
jgi:hypothetical protein